MYKLIELLKVEEELTELTVVLAPIYHPNATSKCGLLKKPQMWEDKAKENKLQKEKYQSDKNDELIKYLNIKILIIKNNENILTLEIFNKRIEK